MINHRNVAHAMLLKTKVTHFRQKKTLNNLHVILMLYDFTVCITTVLNRKYVCMSQMCVNLKYADISAI